MEVYVSNVTSVIREPLSVPATQIQSCRVWARAVKEGEVAMRRRRALKRVDRELEKGNYKEAMSLVKQLKAHPAGLLRGFGAAAPKGPRSVSSLNELKLNGEIEISSVQLVVDAILGSIKCSLEFQLREEEETEVSVQDFGIARDAGSYESIHEDRLMCMQHETGHFLVGYMVGVLPRRYKVPSVEDLLLDRFAQGKVEFIGFECLRYVGAETMSNKNSSKGKLNKETFKKFSSVVLGGMAAEHLLFGYSELLHSDVQKLVTVLEWMGFTEDEVDSETRRAAESAVLILCRQSGAQSMLAEAMALGKSVGFCIETIERKLDLNNI